MRFRDDQMVLRMRSHRIILTACFIVPWIGHLHGQRRNENALLMGYTQYAGSKLNFANTTPLDLGEFPFLAWGECSSAISDTSGNFLFGFGTGVVYDHVGGVIDQSLWYELNGDVTQGSLIFPRPGTTGVYDLFVIKNAPQQGSDVFVEAACLSVDMALNGGLGGVTASVSFGANYTEKLCGTPHGNGTDYWALTHEWGTNAFRAYRIDAAGLDTVPMVSLAGSPHTEAYGDCLRTNYQGEMKFSYAGHLIALCTQNTPCEEGSWAIQPAIVQLFHFNDLTGDVSYWMDLPDHHMTYGLDFSQDGSKLYVAGSDSAVHYVDQYDLDAGDTTAIIGSRYRVYDSTYTEISSLRPSAMSFAPDGRLYVSLLGTSLDAILFPDLPGADCGYTEGFFPLGDMHYFATHCNQLKRYHDSEYKRPGTVGFPSVVQAPGFGAWPNPAASVLHLGLPNGIVSPDIHICDATGRTVHVAGPQAARTGTIDVSSLANGLYTVSLLDGSRILGATRVVVQR